MYTVILRIFIHTSKTPTSQIWRTPQYEVYLLRLVPGTVQYILDDAPSADPLSLQRFQIPNPRRPLQKRSHTSRHTTSRGGCLRVTIETCLPGINRVSGLGTDTRGGRRFLPITPHHPSSRNQISHRSQSVVWFDCKNPQGVLSLGFLLLLPT